MSMSAEMIFGLVGIVSLIIGIPSFVIAWPQIRSYAGSIFSKNSILIFGPKGAGKSCLVAFLKGEPIPEEHVETLGYVRNGKIAYDLSGNNTYYFSAREVVELGGENPDQIKPLIQEINPHGIILVCDNEDIQKDKQAVEQTVAAFKRVLGETIREKLNIAGILILINKCERWGSNSATQVDVEKQYRDHYLKNQIHALQTMLGGVAIFVRSGSIKHQHFRVMTNEALRELASHLAKEA